MARLSQLLPEPARVPVRAARSHEDRLAAYVIREHDRGRSLEDILTDRYILNRTSPQQLRRLLENPDLVRTLGNDTIESVRTTMTSV